MEREDGLSDPEACQPTMRRENTSVTNATYTNPDQVRMRVWSETQPGLSVVAILDERE